MNVLHCTDGLPPAGVADVGTGDCDDAAGILALSNLAVPSLIFLDQILVDTGN